MSQKLETLISSENEQDFATMLQHILDHRADLDVAGFVEYFETHYACHLSGGHTALEKEFT